MLSYDNAPDPDAPCVVILKLGGVDPPPPPPVAVALTLPFVAS